MFRNTKKILPLISLTTLAKILMEDSVVSKNCFLWTGYSICSSALNVLGKQVSQWKLHFHHWKFLVFLSIDHTQDCCPQVVHDRVPSIKMIENWKLLQMDYKFSIIILPAFGFYQQLELFTWLGSWPLTSLTPITFHVLAIIGWIFPDKIKIDSAYYETLRSLRCSGNVVSIINCF